MKKVNLFVLLFFLFTGAYSQNPTSGIIFGTKIGVSQMLTEVTPDFKEHLTEFDHKPGFAMDLELSKLFFNHWEAGTDINFTNLKGETDNPDFTAIGNHHSMPAPIEDPVEYTNLLIGQKFFIGYYFRSFENITSPWTPEPFLRAGIGYIQYGAELKYQDPALGSIFGKGAGDYTNLSMSSMVLFLSAGVKSYVNPNFFINTTFTCNYTNYDYLDAVYNYYSDGTRADLRGIYTEIKVGLYFQSNGSGKGSSHSKGKTADPLPFSR
ncbi:MAG: hypothetical protein ACK5M7_07360 [Draconibacterium sp.]